MARIILFRGISVMGKKNRVVCFKVENYEEAYKRDSELITKLEMSLSGGGAIPAKIDFPSQLCCVIITDPTVRPEDVQQILETFGLRVALINRNAQ